MVPMILVRIKDKNTDANIIRIVLQCMYSTHSIVDISLSLGCIRIVIIDINESVPIRSMQQGATVVY